MTALRADLRGVAAVVLEGRLELMLEHARCGGLALDGAAIVREPDPTCSVEDFGGGSVAWAFRRRERPGNVLAPRLGSSAGSPGPA